MMHWDNNWGWAGWVAMSMMMLAFWAIIAWVAVMLAKSISNSASRSHGAEEILAERFARGEIDSDEFTSRRDALR